MTREKDGIERDGGKRDKREIYSNNTDSRGDDRRKRGNIERGGQQGDRKERDMCHVDTREGDEQEGVR